MSKRTGIIAFLAFDWFQLLPAKRLDGALPDRPRPIRHQQPCTSTPGWNVALPGGYMQLNSSPSLSHAVKQMGGKNQLLLSELGNHLDGDFKVQAQAQLEPFMVSYLRDKLSLAVIPEVGNAILLPMKHPFVCWTGQCLPWLEIPFP